MNDVDIIVLDLDGGTMLEDCLASLRAQTVPARLIVVDNGSSLPVRDRLAHIEAVIIRADRNLGFAGGANLGLRQSDAEYVALVNNDVVLDPDWLRELRGALDRDPQLGAVQSIIRRPDGRIDGAGIDVSDGTFRQIGYGEVVGAPLAVPWGVSATATLYRRAAIGDRFFSEQLFAYYEDVELSARLRAAGWRIAVLPIVLATHQGSQSATRLGGDAVRLRTRNRYLVARAHRGAGRLHSLLWEDFKLSFRRRTSLRGVLQGLFGPALDS
jgi:GT2 family glycosyltransferase